MVLPVLITDEADLLTVLRDAPVARAVIRCVEAGPVVFDCDRLLRPLKVVAAIAEEGSASSLLDRVCRADEDGDVDVWRSLPLRYGPFCFMWVLSEHPHAPAMPG